MPLTDDQLIELRKWVGDTQPTDDVLHDAFDRLGSVTEVAVEMLERRLATWESEPTTFAITGEYSQTRDQENLRRLRNRLIAVGGDAGFKIRIVPVDYRESR